jgi:hypothetical protein
VSTKTVEKDNQLRNVEGIPNQDALAIESNHSSTPAQDRYKCIVAHVYLEVSNGPV